MVSDGIYTAAVDEFEGLLARLELEAESGELYELVVERDTLSEEDRGGPCWPSKSSTTSRSRPNTTQRKPNVGGSGRGIGSIDSRNAPTRLSDPPISR